MKTSKLTLGSLEAYIISMVSESQDLHQVPFKPLTNPYCNICNTNTIPSYNTVVRRVSVTRHSMVL